MIHEVRYNGLMRHITYARLICSHSHGSTHSGNEGGREAKGAPIAMCLIPPPNVSLGDYGK
jgi:hypothetical protein